MSGHEQETDIRDSTPGSTGPDRAAGGMGVSSERVGPTGPGQHATDGIREVDPSGEFGSDGEDLPEQSAGGEEENPAVGEPVAGYPSGDPRSAEKPYEAPPA
jgi:hypothetical protein